MRQLNQTMNQTTHKWWLYSGTALALLAWTTMTGTTAQAATTDASHAATPTTGQTVADSTGQSLQQNQVTLGQNEPAADQSGEATGEAAASATQPAQNQTETKNETDAATTQPAQTDPDATDPVKTDQATNGNGHDTDPAPAAPEPESAQEPDTPASTTPDPVAGTPNDGTTPEQDKSAPATTDQSPASQVMAAKQATPTADVLDEDTDLSDQFADANVLAAVREGLGLADGTPLTLKQIQGFKNNFIQVKVIQTVNGAVEYVPVSSLKGLELLANLPAKTTITLMLQLGTTHADMAGMDLSPLTSLNFSWLDLISDHWGAASADQLATISQIPTTNMRNITLASADTMTANRDGMTNAQFKQLVPWVQAIIENDVSESQMIGFAGNNITDFSVLSAITTHNSTAQVTGLLQYDQRQTTIVYHPGDTVTVDSPVTGYQGESFPYTIRYYQDNDSNKLVTAEAQQVTITDANGQTKTVWRYTLVNPKVTTDGQIVYGQFSYSDATWKNYYTNNQGNPMNELTLAAGTLVFQPVVDAVATTATVTYVDATTGATLTTDQLAGNVGETSDYRTAATIQSYLDQGYELVSDDYPADGVLFTDQAQAFTVRLKHAIEVLANSKTVTQVIQYQYANGTTAAPSYQAWVTFVRQGQTDQVTGETTWEDWHPTSETATLPAKTSPVITGYTADQLVVPAVTGLTPTSENQLTVVTYTATETPVDPGNPVDPETPVEPETPVDPETPVEPETPVDPETPIEPETPVEPEKPVTPGKPDQGGAGNTGAANNGKPTQLIAGGSGATGASTATHHAGSAMALTAGQSGQTATGASQRAAVAATKLPQTNEQSPSVWTLLGSLGIMTLGWFGYRRKNKENE